MEQDLILPLYTLALICICLAIVNYTYLHRLSKLESSMKLLLARQAESFFDMRTTLNLQNAVHEYLLGDPLSPVPQTEEPQSPMDLALTHLRRVRDTLQYARAMHVLAGHYGDNVLHALGVPPEKTHSTKEVVEFFLALDSQPTIPEFLPMRGTMVTEPVGRPNHGYSVGGNGAGYVSAGNAADSPVRVVPADGVYRK